MTLPAQNATEHLAGAIGYGQAKQPNAVLSFGREMRGKRPSFNAGRMRTQFESKYRSALREGRTRLPALRFPIGNGLPIR